MTTDTGPMPATLPASSGPHASSLHQRRRPLRPEEGVNIPWLMALPEAERLQVLPQISMVQAQAGDMICRAGRPVTYWFGVVEGLLKMHTVNTQGQATTYLGIAPGGWFGEGTALKREAYRYNVEALRSSWVAGLPVDSFHALLDHSAPFNRFVMNQLNERVGQFIAALEMDRIPRPELRVARNLVALFHPVLNPGVGSVLRITQQELAYLVGLSRQRVNEALKVLEQAGHIRIEYGGLRVLSLDGLRAV